MNPHIFNGDIRAFAKFKAAFKTITEPRYPDQTEQAYVMRHSCLNGEAENIVESVSNVKKIWERLHDKLGNEQLKLRTEVES